MNCELKSGMTFFIILIIVVLCWPLIKKWTARFVANRTEDYIRKATGMPPRPGSREAKKQARRDNTGARQQSTSSRSSRTSRSTGGRRTGPIIPKEYAVDVEFTETIDYSETVIASDGRRTSAYSYHESQVSDVEWEEVKVAKKK